MTMLSNQLKKALLERVGHRSAALDEMTTAKKKDPDQLEPSEVREGVEYRTMINRRWTKVLIISAQTSPPGWKARNETTGSRVFIKFDHPLFDANIVARHTRLTKRANAAGGNDGEMTVRKMTDWERFTKEKTVKGK